jgi:glyoxylase-like metal-dependent hydrolase (beta-lactamase superfamily II)
MDVKLIEIKQDMPGFNGFLGSWVCQDDINFLVDVGPANTAGRLIDSLASIGLNRVDFIFLTHIHIDHAGALADLLENYPMARVICHEKGIKFLVDPSKLWAGSLEVLGETAKGYGPPKPVKDLKLLVPHTQCSVPDLTVIETPGHAPHHLSFSYKNILFAGEAGGNYFLINNIEYLRPATPPRFFLKVFLNSLDRLLALENQTICYAHFGMAEGSHRLLNKFRDQLLRWKDIIFDQVQKGDEDLLDRCMGALLEKDPDLRAFRKMDPDLQKREKTFLSNSINGFMGFFQE